jgi:hypothetical protein
MKYIIGLNTVLLVLVSLLTACTPDSPAKAGVFLIESDKTYEYPTANTQPREFKDSVTALEGKIDSLHNLGVIGSITNGKLRLALPTYIEDEYLEPVPNSGDLKRGKLGFTSGAVLILSRDADFQAELFYYNRDAQGIKKGWNFRYREPDEPSTYTYTNNIETLYTSDEGYVWLVTFVPGAG